jgi:hypothetical protein
MKINELIIHLKRLENEKQNKYEENRRWELICKSKINDFGNGNGRINKYNERLLLWENRISINYLIKKHAYICFCWKWGV